MLIYIWIHSFLRFSLRTVFKNEWPLDQNHCAHWRWGKILVPSASVCFLSFLRESTFDKNRLRAEIFKKKHKSWCSCWQRGGLDNKSETVQGSTFSFAFVLIRLSCLSFIPNCFITRRTNLSHRRVYKRCTGNFRLHSFSSSCSELVSPRHWQQIGKTRLVAFFFVRYFLM